MWRQNTHMKITIARAARSRKTRARVTRDPGLHEDPPKIYVRLQPLILFLFPAFDGKTEQRCFRRSKISRRHLVDMNKTQTKLLKKNQSTIPSTQASQATFPDTTYALYVAYHSYLRTAGSLSMMLVRTCALFWLVPLKKEDITHTIQYHQ